MYLLPTQYGWVESNRMPLTNPVDKYYATHVIKNGQVVDISNPNDPVWAKQITDSSQLARGTDSSAANAGARAMTAAMTPQSAAASTTAAMSPAVAARTAQSTVVAPTRSVQPAVAAPAVPARNAVAANANAAAMDARTARMEGTPSDLTDMPGRSTLQTASGLNLQNMNTGTQRANMPSLSMPGVANANSPSSVTVRSVEGQNAASTMPALSRGQDGILNTGPQTNQGIVTDRFLTEEFPDFVFEEDIITFE